MQEPELLGIAAAAVMAPVPEGWSVHLDSTGNEFFHHAASGHSTYEHPLDDAYRAEAERLRAGLALCA
jgi:WW domain